MYTMFGACSGLFHLAVKNPILILALSLGGFISQATTGLPGDQLGTESVLESAQKNIVADYPWLPGQMETIRVEFEKLNPVISEESVRTLLSKLEPCSEMTVRDVLSDPAKRREAAWLLYLDAYARGGGPPATKRQVSLNKHGPPP